ncbi:RING-H2 finger protein ATL11-like protein [Carex littledalei]|uniref:RING-H2 finger protein ATL11-like protein n=1 Tax=Carex littledalei TaxID=544730 RepID=A0A833W1S5_9POAL|nr:RING-H2 finger protein ATL11-like protein [Carex littledalei]
MGFPVGYSDLLLPKLVLHLLLLLGAVRRFLLWVFCAVGLGDLLEIDEPLVQGHVASRTLQHRRPEFKSVPSVRIEEVLPVVKFEELDSKAEAVCCAVCLYDIAGREEVRRLTNCCHVFHRGCLDRWMDHDQHTCPLCRAKLIPDEMGNVLLSSGTGGTTDTVGSPFTSTDVLDYDYFFPSLPSSPLPSPILFQPHQLLGAGY